MKKLILSVFALAAVVLSANAQTFEASATADAVLESAITVEGAGSGAAAILGGLTFADGALNFGTIAVGTTGTSTVKIAALTGIRSLTGDAKLNGGTPTAAAFKVSGANLAYTVTLPSSMTITGPGAPLTIDVFETNLGVSNSTVIASGVSCFAVGATLNIPALQVPGPYTGSFNVSVDYN